ncbi:MAG: hypothetical protein ACPLRU_08330 [Desulfofundulus sp.]
MAGKRQLQIRLPDDHWVWRITDPVARNQEVRRALDFYFRFSEEMIELRRQIQEINTKLDRGVVLNNSSEKREDEKKRLFDSLDKLLDW